MNRRAQSQTKRHGECDDACELQSLPKQPQHRARQYHRENARQDAREHHHYRAERQPDEDRHQRELDRQSSVEFLDHVGAVARSDRRQAGDGNLITRMLLADSVQLCIELLDHRQDLT